MRYGENTPLEMGRMGQEEDLRVPRHVAGSANKRDMLGPGGELPKSRLNGG